MVPDKKKENRTIKWPIVATIILSVAIIVIILYFTFTPETLGYLSSVNINLWFFGAAILLNIIYWVLWAVRLRILSDAIDPNIHISLRESTKIIIANLFLASITPSMAGGEPVRIHLLRRKGLSLGQATASVLGERLLDAIFILVLIPFAFFMLKDQIDIGFIQIGISIGIVFFIIAIILFLYSINNPEKTKSFLYHINKKISKLLKIDPEKSERFVDRINIEVDNFHDSMIFFINKGRRAFISAGVITVLFWSIGFMIPSMILLGLGLSPFFIESYAAQVLLIVIIMVPTTPGSSGIAEGGVAALYSVLIGTSFSYLLGVFVLLFRLITFHMNLIAGAVFQYHIFKSVASFSLDSLNEDS
jgi:uncharacterized protein (TIRG00374 family)